VHGRLQRIRGLKGFTRFINDERRRELVESILAAFDSDVFPDAGGFRRGVLMCVNRSPTGPHRPKPRRESSSTPECVCRILRSDFNDANIIVDTQDVERVVGVIDLGDSIARWAATHARTHAYLLLVTEHHNAWP
jgi:hypothetical protein